MDASGARSIRPDPEREGDSEADSSAGGAAASRLTPLRELQLIEAYQQGRPEAIEDLLRAYQRRVYGVCYRMVRNADEASDLTQDALVRIIEGLHSYDGRAALSTWIIRVTMNCCLSHLRKQKLRRHGSLDEPAGGGPEPWSARLEAEGELSAPRRVEQAETRAALLRALRELDPDMRAILVLRDLQDLDYQQIGEVLEIPIGTVKSRLFRARVALREAARVQLGQSPQERGEDDRTGETA
ncbi:MAG: sigma-70 family RNA polymerase sigma factor [Planctomycetota bacterium]|nr:sigma-70 family RNA polymerase sigma factor [Planctomycetota bacterium]